MRGDREPFNDRNVRIAMQKAINLAEINSGYYYGMANPTPSGFITSLAPGMFIPFEEWPADIKAQYEYDPAEAERLLDEAGYPRDSGTGVRFTAGWDLKAEWAEDVDLALLASSYWKKIGVDVEVNAQSDDGVYFNRILEASHGGMTHGCCRHKNVLPVGEMSFSVGLAGGYTYLDELIARAGMETDTAAYRQIAREMDERYIREVSLHLPRKGPPANAQPALAQGLPGRVWRRVRGLPQGADLRLGRPGSKAENGALGPFPHEYDNHRPLSVIPAKAGIQTGGNAGNCQNHLEPLLGRRVAF